MDKVGTPNSLERMWSNGHSDFVEEKNVTWYWWLRKLLYFITLKPNRHLTLTKSFHSWKEAARVCSQEPKSMGAHVHSGIYVCRSVKCPFNERSRIAEINIAIKSRRREGLNMRKQEEGLRVVIKVFAL